MTSNLISDIREALEKLKTLEIITAVGDVDLSDAPAGRLPLLRDGTAAATIVTRIDLLQGDIQTVFSPEIVTGDYQSLRDFHAQREEQGHQIVLDNIKALKALISLAMSPELREKSEQDEPAYSLSNEN